MGFLDSGYLNQGSAPSGAAASNNPYFPNPITMLNEPTPTPDSGSGTNNFFPQLVQNLQQTQQQQQLPFSQIISLYQGLYGPEQQALANQNDNLQLQGLGYQQGYDQSVGSAQAQYQASLGLLGLDQRSTNQQLAGNSALSGLYDQQTSIYRDLYNQMQTQANAQAGQQRFDVNSQATARGAYGSVAQKQQLGTINTINQAQNAQYNAQFGIQANQNDISQARLANERAQLQSTADSYGLKADQLKAQLDSGLSKLGLDNLMNTSQLLDMISSNDIQQATIGRQIIEQALNTPQDVLSVLAQNGSGF